MITPYIQIKSPQCNGWKSPLSVERVNSLKWWRNRTIIAGILVTCQAQELHQCGRYLYLCPWTFWKYVVCQSLTANVRTCSSTTCLYCTVAQWLIPNYYFNFMFYRLIFMTLICLQGPSNINLPYLPINSLHMAKDYCIIQYFCNNQEITRIVFAFRSLQMTRKLLKTIPVMFTLVIRDILPSYS